MAEVQARPKFFECWLDDIKEDYRDGGFVSVFPWWLTGYLVGGIVVALLIPIEFWAVENWEVSAAVYAAILTLNGLVLALGWSAFSRIYESACSPGFSTYLRERGLLSQYIFYVGWVHLWQLIAIIVSAVGLLVVLIDRVPLLSEQLFFGFMIGVSCYAIHQASGAVTRQMLTNADAGKNRPAVSVADQRLVPSGMGSDPIRTRPKPDAA